MRKRALITGSNGFVGSYLSRFLRSLDYEIWGIDIADKSRNDGIKYRKIDLSDYDISYRFILESEPNEVYHLAAVANPRRAKEAPVSAYNVAMNSTLGVLNAVRDIEGCKVLLIGSSEEYRKKEGNEMVYCEEDPIENNTIYGSTKILSESIGRAYYKEYGVPVYFTRSFNHTGPEQSSEYVLSDFAMQVSRLRREPFATEIVTGNIDIDRDFLDVRDVVRAYYSILNEGRPGEIYNVCSHEPTNLRRCIEYLLEVSGNEDVNIVVDRERVRLNEPRVIVGNNHKLQNHTTWVNEIPMTKTLLDMYNWWKMN